MQGPPQGHTCGSGEKGDGEEQPRGTIQEREQGGGADSPLSHFLARGRSEPGCFSHASHLRLPFCGEQTPAPQGERAGPHTVPSLHTQLQWRAQRVGTSDLNSGKSSRIVRRKDSFDGGAGEILEPSCPFLDYHMSICTPTGPLEGTQECQTLKNPPTTLLPRHYHRARLGIFPLRFFFFHLPFISAKFILSV